MKEFEKLIIEKDKQEELSQKKKKLTKLEIKYLQVLV